MAGMFPVPRCVPRVGLQYVGLVFLNADLVHARNRAPEAHEVVHLAGVALHPDHLDHHLHLRAALVFHAGEANEIVAYLLEIRALAVVFERFLGRAIEAQRDVFERRREQPCARLFVEECAVGREQSRNAVALAVFDPVENLAVHEGLAEADEHHVLGASARFTHQPLENLVGHVFPGLLVCLAGAHGTIQVALRRSLYDVLHRQSVELRFAPQVAPQQFGAIYRPHGKLHYRE
jgi:hypothetical protein